MGADGDWLWDDQNRRVAFYSNLRPGDCTFHVTACNSHGMWNEQGEQFSFYVAPHSYETWPFDVACGAILVFAGPALHYRRMGRLRRVQRLEQQRALHEERARIAKDLHDDLGATLTGLALQLDLARSQGLPADTLQERLANLARHTLGLVDNTREVVWAMNPQHDNVESLASFLGQYTEEYLAGAGLRCRLELPSNLPRQPPDVVLMDIDLPGQSGIECVRRLKTLFPELQIIMLTIEDDSRKVFESLKAGASGYLVKNPPPAQILAAVEDVHRGGSPMSSQIARLLVQRFQPAGRGQDEMAHLTPREDEVLGLAVKGYRSKEIADALSLSTQTVQTHFRNLYEKLHVRSRAEVVARYLGR